MLRGGVWPLQQYTVLLLKSHIRSRKYFTSSSLDVEFLGSPPILSSSFLLQVHCLNAEHWQFSYCAAINIDKCAGTYVCIYPKCVLKLNGFMPNHFISGLKWHF